MTETQKPLTYSDAGVDISAATTALSSIKELVRRTYTEHVLRDIGTFGAMFQLGLENYPEPVLVSSVDGVGTKLKLAFMTGRHNTVGIDLVSHCVNDILVQGARPLFFLDYFAMGKLNPRSWWRWSGACHRVPLCVVPSLAAKRPRCRICIATMSMTLQALS